MAKANNTVDAYSSGGLQRSLKTPIQLARWSLRSIVQRPQVPYYRRIYSATSPEQDFLSDQAERRLHELQHNGVVMHPRIEKDNRAISCENFISKYVDILPTHTRENVVVIRGRVRSIRMASSKLVFLDVIEEGHKVQILADLRNVEGVTREEFKSAYRIINRGDILSFVGNPHRTNPGELSLKTIQLPKLLSPCLHNFPTSNDTTVLANDRQAELLASPTAAQILRIRSQIIQYIRQFLLDQSFLEVQTPILASAAGGAIAQPFKTQATEFPDRPLAMRIAPELWLKRLVVGGLDRVFEIGPSFRNEGLDATHNPEFTTCEFYKAYASLDDLIEMTESLFHGLSSHLQPETPTLADRSRLQPPFPRLDFITTLQAHLRTPLPDLTTPTALQDLLTLFKNHDLPIPTTPTLPRLLDKLSTHILEPLCGATPTFIIRHPRVMSPLAKTIPHPTLPGHPPVSARAELFINGREYVNLYEEENSPVEQQKKLREQLHLQAQRGGEEQEKEIDQEYVEALGWGLPPTGGWGCGIDRLVMLFTGAKRIEEVLSFGGLRTVSRMSGGVRGKKDEA
ncbi:MAG: hypothetical protein M1834_005675 [Cirrosporium novae-zelandiae]|nr:MAG: hypothetical protein M1834_005675 [Cirrosporium novae-zelandiae]